MWYCISQGFCNANSKYIIILKAVYILHKDCVPNYYGNKQKKKEIYNQEKLPLITWRNHFLATQLTFTCSKSTVETLKKGIKYVQSLQ